MPEDLPELNFPIPPEFHGQLTPPPPVRMEIRNPAEMQSFLNRMHEQEQEHRRIEIDITEKPKEANHGT